MCLFEKIDFRKLSSQDRLSYRKRAISLINTGEKKKDVALIFGVRPGTVSDWIKAFERKGIKGLQDVKRGMKSEDRKLLKIEQEFAIQKMILDIMPESIKVTLCSLDSTSGKGSY